VPFSIYTNVPSLLIQQAMHRNQAGLERSLLRISSGFRINSAADDAAGVAFSARMDGQSRSHSVAERNTSTAISMASTADDGAAEIGDVLTRMRELAVEAKDGVLTLTERAALDVEYQELRAEIDRLAGATTFNGTLLLSGSNTTIAFQVGIGSTVNDLISVGFGGVSASNLGLAATSVTGSAATNATTALSAIDLAIVDLGTTRTRLGSAVNRLGFALSHSQGMRSNLDASVSAIRDADLAEEASHVARYQVLIEAGSAALAAAHGLGATLIKKLLDF